MNLPNEIALITYKNSRLYRAARDSEVGQVYGPLHQKFFLMNPQHPQNSKSTVAEIWTGNAKIGSSYDLSFAGVDWQSSGGIIIAHLRADDPQLNDEKYTEGVSQYLKSIEPAIVIGLVLYNFILFKFL